MNSIWWNGPQWLSQTTDQWPDPKISLVRELSSEVSGVKVLYEAKLAVGESPEGKTPVDLSDIKAERFSSLQRLLKVTAWIVRVINKLTKRSTSATVGPLTPEEIAKAKLLWDTYIQQKRFADTIRMIKSGEQFNLKDQLNLMLDQHGVIRCHGRYQNAQLSQGAKYPKLLPRKEYYTQLVIEDSHCNMLHAGVSQTLAEIRQNYWIPKGRSEVRKVLKNCKVCQRTEGGPFKMPKMPPWPKERVMQSAPFEYTGVDYFGPMYVKYYTTESTRGEPPVTRKVWICLFTCFAVRAIHLELAEDMTAEEFLLCLRRFIARRGKPKQILSDNAKHFKTASKVLDDIWKSVIISDKVDEFSTSKGIQWKYIVELAPWMGGLYERLVGLTKRALRKAIGNQCLTEKQLVTVLTEVESVINSRPLVYVDDDINSSIIITPSSFLSLNHQHFIPDYTAEADTEFQVSQTRDTSHQILERWKTGQKYLNQFWQIWNREYLLSLRERNQSMLKQPRKGTLQIPQVGDIVLIKENLPRGQWKVGRISRLVEGKDNVIRSAKVMLPSKRCLHRALKLLYPIECPDTEIKDSGDSQSREDNSEFESEEDHRNNVTVVREAAIKARQKIKSYMIGDES